MFATFRILILHSALCILHLFHFALRASLHRRIVSSFRLRKSSTRLAPCLGRFRCTKNNTKLFFVCYISHFLSLRASRFAFRVFLHFALRVFLHFAFFFTSRFSSLRASRFAFRVFLHFALRASHFAFFFTSRFALRISHLILVLHLI